MRYRKLPVEINAWQWFEGMPVDVMPVWLRDAITADVAYFFKTTLMIRTLEGPMTASDGDYIIQGVKGEIYPCKAEIFEITYEKVMHYGRATATMPVGNRDLTGMTSLDDLDEFLEPKSTADTVALD